MQITLLKCKILMIVHVMKNAEVSDPMLYDNALRSDYHVQG